MFTQEILKNAMLLVMEKIVSMLKAFFEKKLKILP
jgi:hypothetical protein